MEPGSMPFVFMIFAIAVVGVVIFVAAIVSFFAKKA